MSVEDDFYKPLFNELDQYDLGTFSPPFPLPEFSPMSGLNEVELLQEAEAEQKKRRPRGPNWEFKYTDHFVKLRKEGYNWDAISERLQEELHEYRTRDQLQEKWATLRKYYLCIDEYEETVKADNQMRSYWVLDAAQRSSLKLKSQSSSFSREWFEIVKSVEEKRKPKTSRKRQPNLRSKGLSKEESTDYQPSKSLTTGDSVSGCTGPAASADILDSHQDAGGNSIMESFKSTITQGSELGVRMLDVKEKGIQMDRQFIAEVESSGKRRRH